jgi:hypothetical protein
MKKYGIFSALLALSIILSAHAQEHDHHSSDKDTHSKTTPSSQTTHDMESMQHAMRGFYGAYPMSREASGTSWQPEATPADGIHTNMGEWSTMWHGFINAIYDHQGGPRGDSQTISQSMLMGMGQRSLGEGTLGLRGMISLDPMMGKRGYPLLFQTGETADGENHLVDRQHPHDFFMELAVSYSHPITSDSSAFIYAGLPGEPALGPPAFMHRFSGMENPEAPLTHHWLDSTHITFGVVTLGATWHTVKLEGSVFNGREPDQYRYNIETRELDSASARLSWNPTPAWALQISHGRLESPELLEPEVSMKRTTASASYQHNWRANQWQTMLAWGRNNKDPGITTDGWLLESALRTGNQFTYFGRIERVENGELFEHGDPMHGRVFKINKVTLGTVYDFARYTYAKIGVGASVSRYVFPDDLNNYYGSNPTSYMLFLRAKLD